MQIIPMLTDPAAHGGDAEQSFTVIAPSLPGYGFSDHPHARAINIQAIAEIFHQADDRGARLSSAIARRVATGVPPITSRLGEVHGDSSTGSMSTCSSSAAAAGACSATSRNEEKVFLADLDNFRREETGYQSIQGTKPQTLAYGLNDSPAGLAAWIVEKFRTWSDCDGDVEQRFTKDQLLTNVMIYWITPVD